MDEREMMYEMYLLYSGGHDEHIIDYELFDTFELLLIRDDGLKELFNSVDKTFRVFRPEDQDIIRMGKEAYVREFGFRLTSKLRDSPWTLEQLADRTGISISMLYLYLRGEGNPSFYNVIKLADALNCDIHEFLRIPK